MTGTGSRWSRSPAGGWCCGTCPQAGCGRSTWPGCWPTRIADVVVEPVESAAVELAGLDETGQAELGARAGHVREVLTGYQRGSVEVALP
jgi:hypothetical protein